ncbi:PA14 domain-containing protein [Streptomyces candidus]|uniref:PA14 domain-containing protein n=1 Tax=Streptomyces candidus TaxID=67283 RepID=A0A7X0HJK3_9ACTN|nr:PA14 domain-containing protein [Streptomyces candidus]MBB6438849.1 hypothetical protein [Streptomyces candidus]GHH52731.1 hypothetical protein GCM10018773_53230 [Streptomyces candidus]
MSAVDWSSAADFEGLEDNFVSRATGNIKVPQNGTYAFRLISDDGSRLSVGERTVIEHDGLHGPEPKDGSIDLVAGYQPLLIEHFERSGTGRPRALTPFLQFDRRCTAVEHRGVVHAEPAAGYGIQPG